MCNVLSHTLVCCLMFMCCISAPVDGGLGQLCVMFFVLPCVVSSSFCVVLQHRLMVAWASGLSGAAAR